MGRPRNFEEAAAVRAASTVFRQRGYASTSVDHLVEATGVHRGSLYGVFGSKFGLFLRALDQVTGPEADPDERLDLVLVALLELAPDDPQVRDRVAALIATHHLTDDQLGRRLRVRAGTDRAEPPRTAQATPAPTSRS